MSIKNKIAQYKEWKSGVKHCTFDPDGPGVVRIHLIPPKFKLFGSSPYIVILNGYYLLPLGYSWAVILSAFIGEVNKHDGVEIDRGKMDLIIENTVKNAHGVYRSVTKEALREDLFEMLDILFTVARGGDLSVHIPKLSIRSYSKHMYAPHRMDLMVSAMTDEGGSWKCNQKCMFCYAAGQKHSSRPELSTDEWKAAIDKLRNAGVPMLTFTGGEPTMRDDISELIDHSKWFVTRLNTNGVNLTPELVKKLRAAGLDSVQITLYSSDETVHNRLVGSEHFADTVRGIENALAAGLDVSINTPICKLNRSYVKTLKMLHGMGVRYVTASGLICTGGAVDKHGEYDLSSSELYEIIKEAKGYCDEVGMEIDFTSPGLIGSAELSLLGMNVPSCGAALSNMAIAPDGAVVPCQSWLSGEASLGNILTDEFKNIWNSELCRSLRKMTDEEALCCPFRMRKEGNADV